MTKAIAAIALAIAPALAGADVVYHEAPVLDVEPVRTVVRVVEPAEQCWTEESRQREPSAGEREGEPLASRLSRGAGAPLLGAVVGGALGNAVGHNKSNKRVGTVVGAVLGGAIAHDLTRRHDRRPEVRSRGRIVQRVCETYDRVRTEERITGYLVTYRYAGETYRARTERRPGETIRVRVRVTPV